jgi:hypothetical protein
MGFGPFSSESKAEDSRIAATDQSTVVRGKGKVLRAGAVDLANSKVNTGLELKSIKGNLTITNNNGASADLIDKLSGFLTSNNGPGSAPPPAPVTTPAPGAVTTADTTTTGSKTWVYIGLLLAAGLAYYFFKKR